MQQVPDHLHVRIVGGLDVGIHRGEVEHPRFDLHPVPTHRVSGRANPHAAQGSVVVSDELISGLKQWASAGNGILTRKPQLKLGDKVEVMSGPMQGVSGIILDNSNDRDRVTLLLSILQCGAQLSVDRSEIRLIA